MRAQGDMDSFRWYLETQYPRRLAQVTITNYYSQARQWVTWCEDNDLDYHAVTADDLARYLGGLQRQWRPNTVRHRQIALKILYDYGCRKGWMNENPVRVLPQVRPQEVPVEEFTEKELRGMYAACKSHRERAVFLLLLGSGLRRDEVFHISRKAVNWEAGTITVLGKGQQYRLVAPGPMAMAELEKALEFDERLCPYRWNIYIEKLVKRLGEKAGIQGRVHPHRFRAHFAAAFLEAGGSIDELATILGHRRVDQSIYYARANKKRRALNSQARIDVASRVLLGDTGLREVQTA